MRLSIPKPCHENWNEMTPVEQGAFCNACAKVVVDFSTMSDAEVIHYFENKQEGKTCGRFRASQLSPYEFKVNWRSIASQKSFPKIFAAAVFIFFSSLFVCKSDTGDLMSLKVIAADTKDSTAAVVQLVPLVYALDTANVSEELTGDIAVVEEAVATEDTLHVKLDAVVVQEERKVGEMSYDIMGAIVIEKPVARIDTTPIVTGDTVIFPQTLKGEVEMINAPMIKGNVTCTKPAKEKEVAKPKTKRQAPLIGFVMPLKNLPPR